MIVLSALRRARGPMLQLLGVTVQLGDRVLMDKVDLRLGPRERIALVGRNGAGKSTLMKAAVGIIPYDGGEVSLGRHESAAYLKQEHLVSSDRSLWDEVYAVLEPIVAMEREANELFATASAPELGDAERDELLRRASALHERFQVCEGFSAEARCGRVLSGLGFGQHDWSKQAASFSGGKQVTIGLARLLLERPSYLLLDEPTNHLDIETRTWLLHELKVYPGGVLLISHDRDFLDRLVTRTIEIEDASLTSYSGGYTSYRRQRDERVAQLLAQAAAQAEERARLQAFIRRFRAKASKAAQVQSRVKMLEKMPVIKVPQQQQDVRLRFPDPPPAPSPMLELRDVSKSYGSLAVLRDVNLSVYAGERILLVGANGAGKSTLLKLISGIEQADDGVLQVMRGTRHAWFAQDQARELPAELTVLEATQAADRLLSVARCRSLLGALLFRGDDVHKLCSVLSGGEKSRVALGRVLLERANLLLLDEPTNHLDIQSKDVLADALEHFSGTILFVSHDREFANRLSTSIWEVGGGGVTAHAGNLDEFLWSKAIAAGVVQRRGPGEPAPDAWLLGGLPEAPQPQGAVETTPTTTADAASETSELSWKERKRLASLMRRQRVEADDLMARLEQLEEQMAGLDASMADRVNASQWDKLQAWSKERGSLDSERSRAYERWEELETLLAGAE